MLSRAATLAGSGAITTNENELRRILAGLLLVVFTAQAGAASFPGAIKGYNGITSSFSSNAGACGIADPAFYEARLMDRQTGAAILMNG
jgi:hypothetical protein